MLDKGDFGLTETNGEFNDISGWGHFFTLKGQIDDSVIKQVFLALTEEKINSNALTFLDRSARNSSLSYQSHAIALFFYIRRHV